MKVVLFCGGLGLRMREVSQRIPKPMIPVGGCPILLHVMKYYAHHGHTDFILCLGYKARVIKDFFRNSGDPFLKNFVISDDGRGSRRSDTQEWRITFADTGVHANIGQRLKAVRNLVGRDEVFLANYSDVLTDAPLPSMISEVVDQGKVANFLCVRPRYSFHVVSWKDGRVVRDIRAVTESDVWINGGYFVFRNEIFKYMEDGDELVEEPFRRLIDREELLAHRYEGFWAPMDTFKDWQNLDALCGSGRRPWAVWEPEAAETAPIPAVPVPAA